MRLARLGSEQGDPGATFLVGFLLANGCGVAESRDEACKWYRQAAVLGEEGANDSLRRLAREGHAPSLAAVRELGLRQL